MNASGRYRRYLGAAFLGTALLAFAGCGEAKKRPAFAPAADARCALCGMVVANYEGPKAELYLKGVERPAVFCSLRDGLSFLLQPENRRRLEAFYVQTADGATAFLDAESVVFVIGSRFEGVMGAEPAALSTSEAADRFIEKMGGRRKTFADLALEDLA